MKLQNLTSFRGLLVLVLLVIAGCADQANSSKQACRQVEYICADDKRFTACFYGPDNVRLNDEAMLLQRASAAFGDHYRRGTTVLIIEGSVDARVENEGLITYRACRAQQ